MDKKEKLLNSLDGLEMSFKKKQEFVNILVGDSGSDNGGSDSSESTMEYLDVSGYDDKFMFADILTFATLVRVNLPPINIIGGFGLSIVESNIAEALPKVQFMAIDLTLPVIYGGTFYNSIYDYLISSNSSLTEEELDAIPRITKEQFYNTNSDSN